MYCEKCDKNIPENLNYCPTCKLMESNHNEDNKIVNSLLENGKREKVPRKYIKEDYYEKEIITAENSKDIIKKNNHKAYLSLILSIIPYVIFFITGAFAGGWLMGPFALILSPVIIISTINGVKGLNSQKKGIAILALIINAIPSLMFIMILLLLFVTIINYT